ncbi:hypothetical protein DY000_02006075 [Brassica cretica]|uniref:Uncharacterized protein n=1 Tax=Brassica cretica TaxID=69181 RepID=A0ABQ7BTK5_BRACR|nr:hypothetical protein DY000_02006075 [Brassica cretica]
MNDPVPTSPLLGFRMEEFTVSISCIKPLNSAFSSPIFFLHSILQVEFNLEDIESSIVYCGALIHLLNLFLQLINSLGRISLVLALPSRQCPPAFLYNPVKILRRDVSTFSSPDVFYNSFDFRVKPPSVIISK